MRNLWRAIKAVLSAFAGIRNSAAADSPDLRAHHYIIAGILSVLCLIALLVAAVNAIV